MFKTQLQYYAALVAHFDLTGHEKCLDMQEIQEVVNNIMGSGVYKDTFIDILYPTSEYSTDFLLPLKKVLESLEIEIPQNYQEAVYDILRYHLSRISQGAIKPFEGMLAISTDLGWYYDMDAPGEHYYIWDYQDKEKLSQITQEIADLVGLCWLYRADFYEVPHVISYNDYRGEEAIHSLETDIFQTAKVWLEQQK